MVKRTANHVLTLTDDQLYEVYNAAWREFVDLHRHTTANPNGVHEAVIERARQSRAAIGEVCDMIEELKPDWVATREDYTAARKESRIVHGHDQDPGIKRSGNNWSQLCVGLMLATTLIALYLILQFVFLPG